VPLCLTPDPSDTVVLCDKPSPCYGFHANATASRTWPGNPLPERPAEALRGRNRKAALALIADRAQR
jgi:hypothetical protein